MIPLRTVQFDSNYPLPYDEVHELVSFCIYSLFVWGYRVRILPALQYINKIWIVGHDSYFIELNRYFYRMLELCARWELNRHAVSPDEMTEKEKKKLESKKKRAAKKKQQQKNEATVNANAANKDKKQQPDGEIVPPPIVGIELVKVRSRFLARVI